MIKPIFKSEDFQKHFDENGYVIVPFLNEEMVQDLSAFYEALKDKHEITASVHSTCDTNDQELIRTVDKRIKDTIIKRAEEIFFDYKLFLSNFLIKEPGEDSSIYPHQDWTFVDESRFASASIWCPLTDVDEKNGCIRVLKGSHCFVETLRASPDYPSAFREVVEMMDQFMVSLPMRAGEALIYNHALIHASSPNLSELPRPVVVTAIIPREAELYFYYYAPAPGARKIEKFQVDTEFFYSYPKHSRPQKVKSLGYVERIFKAISPTDFLHFVKAGELPQPPKSIFEKLVMSFKSVN
jgi:ectoine hydroxylase-related dioxygenase (phytanoyl-CoA dioxygenase family)